MNTISGTFAIFTAATLLAVSAHAQTHQPAVKVERAWARSTVPGQKASGAFMDLTAGQATTVVGVSSPAAAVTEVHEMKMEGDIMRMRALPRLDLPAGKPVQLKPGGFHIMLMDLKAPLMPGATVPVTLLLRNAQGTESRQEVLVPVTTAAPAAHGTHKH